MNGFVIGNGESRKGIDLSVLKRYGPVFGCNALYRDFIPDLLMTVDQHMINIIERDRVSEKCEVMKRVVTVSNDKTFESSRGFIITDPYHAAAGPSALFVMCDRFKSLELKNVYLIGFDIFSDTDTVNNVYKNTEGYVSSDHKPTYTRNWIVKLGRIFLSYPDITFYRVCVGDIKLIEEWNRIPNVIYTTFELLMKKMEVR
jgi:hypothetical protein